ncbi:MAG TPA: CPBP family intramembrane glutamic endopeptidase [Chitinophagaceae bacterium]
MNEPLLQNNEPHPLIRIAWIRVLVFCICYLLVFLITGSIYYTLKERMNISEQAFFRWSFVLSFFTSMLMVFIFRRAFDRRTLLSLGFELKDHYHDAATGLLLGIVLLGVESLILHFTGHLEWIGVNFNADALLSGLVMMMLVAVSEEAVFRGYILNNLMKSMNRWVALAISSLLFALFHSANPGSNPLAIFYIFLAGFVLGVNYIFTGNLWFAIMFHFSWNFFLGPVLGYEVSGLPLISLLEQDISGPDWLTGGEFGLEGSILDGIFSVIVFILLLNTYRKRQTAEVEKQILV